MPKHNKNQKKRLTETEITEVIGQENYGSFSTADLYQGQADQIDSQNTYEVAHFEPFEDEGAMDETASIASSQMTDIAAKRKLFVDTLPRWISPGENAATWAMTPILIETFTRATQAMPANVSEQVYRYWIASFFTLGALAKMPMPEFEPARQLQAYLKSHVPGYSAMYNKLTSTIASLDLFMGDKVNMTCSYTFAFQSSIGHFIALLDEFLEGGVNAEAEKTLFDNSETALNVTFSVAAVAGLCASACLTAYQAKVRTATPQDRFLRRMFDVILRDVLPIYTFSSSVYYLMLNAYETIMFEVNPDYLLSPANSIWVKLAGSGMGLCLAIPTALATYHRSTFQSSLHSVLSKTLILFNFLFVLNSLLEDFFNSHHNPLAFTLIYGVTLAVLGNLLMRVLNYTCPSTQQGNRPEFDYFVDEEESEVTAGVDRSDIESSAIIRQSMFNPALSRTLSMASDDVPEDDHANDLSHTTHSEAL